MSQLIKAGFLVAYDWYYLEHSLPLIYNSADIICLSIDKDRVSWSGQPYPFDETAFQELIKKIDIKGKIFIYEDDFHIPALSPMDNEVRQRNLMADRLGKDGSWHIQLDADEYFLDFDSFVDYLKTHKFQRSVNICCPFYIMFKKVSDGYLFIKHFKKEKIEFIPIASNNPHYQYGRRNGYFNIKTDYTVIHQSWARESGEILQKIENWGHKTDFDVMQYYQQWALLDNDNFKNKKNFHPIEPGNWEALEKITASNINQLIDNLKKYSSHNISRQYLMKENSIWISRAKALWNKMIH